MVSVSSENIKFPLGNGAIVTEETSKEFELCDTKFNVMTSGYRELVGLIINLTFISKTQVEQFGTINVKICAGSRKPNCKNGKSTLTWLLDDMASFEEFTPDFLESFIGKGQIYFKMDATCNK